MGSTQVAVHKPAGLQVLPTGPFIQRTALTLLRGAPAQWPQLREAPVPVHRLGRGTSGERTILSHWNCKPLRSKGLQCQRVISRQLPCSELQGGPLRAVKATYEYVTQGMISYCAAGVLLCGIGVAARTQLALNFQGGSNGISVAADASTSSPTETPPAHENKRESNGGKPPGTANPNAECVGVAFSEETPLGQHSLSQPKSLPAGGGSIQKEYLALITGHLDADEGTVQVPAHTLESQNSMCLPSSPLLHTG